MKDLSVRQESIKSLQENIGSNLSDLNYSNFLQDMSLNARDKSKNELLGLHQDKKLLHSKVNSRQNQNKTKTKLKNNLQNGSRYLQMSYQIKG